MKTIILYKTKYGSTKIYAQWLAEELGAELARTEAVSATSLGACDQIILGGSLFASGIRGVTWLKKNYAQLHGKRIAVFAVGASPCEEHTLAEVRQHNLEPELSELPLFYLRGRFDVENMTWSDRKLCALLKRQWEKKPANELSGLERALLEAYSHNNGAPATFNWMSKDQLSPICAWARESAP